ncbi:MAG: transporter substrate-binding domain-containing protein [Desulfobacterales bacterium]|nr:transporter substrate-binding domain-containing protein [Desulfobacterales bacterium]
MTRYFWSVFFMIGLLSATAWGNDLKDVQTRGVLRHLGIPYANFVTGSGDGLDMEIIRRFAKSLGVAYQFVPTTWTDSIGDLTGRKTDDKTSVPIKGDILASGITILDWRKNHMRFSIPVFPSQVWLVARADADVSPIVPGNSLEQDIKQVMGLIEDKEVLGLAQTCLDPALYGLDKTGARLRYFKGRLNEIAPALVNNDASLALLDVPDALLALEKWPGQLKIIGPVSGPQKMAAAFRRSSPELTLAFNRFFIELWESGVYQSLVEIYYPVFPGYFPEFFSKDPGTSSGENE